MPEFERTADPVDRATLAEEQNLVAELAEQRRKAAQGQHPGPDYSICIACEEEIEPLRVQHGFARCLACQVSYEKRKKQFN